MAVCLNSWIVVSKIFLSMQVSQRHLPGTESSESKQINKSLLLINGFENTENIFLLFTFNIIGFNFSCMSCYANYVTLTLLTVPRCNYFLIGPETAHLQFIYGQCGIWS